MVRMIMIKKNLQTINAGEGIEHGNPLMLFLGMLIGAAPMENSLEVP